MIRVIVSSFEFRVKRRGSLTSPKSQLETRNPELETFIYSLFTIHHLPFTIFPWTKLNANFW